MSRPSKYAGNMYKYTKKMHKYADEDERYIVSLKACKGCMYYRPLSWGGFGEGKEMCCEYFLRTGTLRPDEPCDECSVKTAGKLELVSSRGYMINYSPASIERQKMGKQKREPRT